MLDNVRLFSQYYKTYGLSAFLYPDVVSNWILNKREAKKRPAFVKSRPNIIQIELTNVCNLCCKYCYRGRLDEFPGVKFGYMKEKDFKKIVSEIKTPVSIGFVGGGETMLHPQMFEFAKHISQIHKPSILSVTTNGTLLDESMALKLIDSNISKLYVTIDAASPETYIKSRGRDYFNKIIKGVQTLVELKKQKASKTPIIGLSFIILEENKHEILDFLKLAISLKVDFIGTLRLPHPVSPEGAFMNKSSLDDIYKKLIEARKYLESNNFWVKESIMYNPEQIFDFQNRKGYFCSTPWEFPQVTWEGELTPCCVIPFSEIYSFGNIIKSSFGEVWNSAKAVDFRRKIKSATPPINWCKKCMGC
ncbi:MAG: radical SAM protein [bacterium]|nr:radical SAM protein [bacterium]